jgi:putative hydrolase of HD superfamily
LKNRERLKKQINFISEIDKLKNIGRQTYLIHDDRHENDAEHSWHIAVMALILSEYAEERRLDILRVVKMLLIHDIVEIDAGDTFIYDTEGNKDKWEREQKAAERIFHLLPDDQAKELYELWEEFEEKESEESKFAASLDRFQPLLHNYLTRGKAWKEHNIQSRQVKQRNEHMNNGSSRLWNYAKKLINSAVKRGYLHK